MSVHYPSWGITNYISGDTVYWKYSNGNPILLNQYDSSTPANYWTTALYQINGGGWNTATSTSYPLSSLSPGDTIEYAIVWWDFASDVGSTSSSNYRINSYTKPSSTTDCPTPGYATFGTHEWDYDPTFVIGHNESSLVSQGYTVTPIYWFDFSTWERTDSVIYIKNITQTPARIYYRVKVSRSGYNTSYGPTSYYDWSKRTCSSVSNSTPVMSGNSAYFYISHSDYHQPHIRWTKYQGTTFLDGGTVDSDEVYVPLDYGQTAHFYGWQTHLGWYDGPNSAEIDLYRERLTCPGIGSVSISELSDGSGVVATAYNIPTGYRLYMEYQVNGTGNWYPVENSTTNYSYNSYTSSPINAVNFTNGSTVQVRAYLGAVDYYDGPMSYSNQITYIRGTCPTPNSLTAVYNESTGNIDIYVSADSGYFIQVLYSTGGSNNSLTNGYSPISYNFDVSSIGNGVTVTIYAYCTKSYYNNSEWISTSVYLNRRPICNILNFTAGQQMTAQNIVRNGGQVTADVIVMPYSTWNSFTSKINEFRQYYDYKYGTYIGQYTFTNVGSGTTFTADIYNEARNAINAMFDTYEGLPSVSSGVTEISATVLMDLQNKLNSVS